MRSASIASPGKSVSFAPSSNHRKQGLYAAWMAKFLVLLAAWIASGSTVAWANILYWDPTVSAGVNLGGTGNWGPGSPFWFNGTTNVAWVSPDTTDTASFGGTAGTVTLSSSQSANALAFSSNGYILSGSTLTLGGTNPSITFGGAVNTAVINSALIDPSGIAASLGSGTLTLGGNISGTGALNQTSGALILGGSNTAYSGNVSVTASGTVPATLQLTTANGLGGAKSLTLLNNSTLSNVFGGTGAALDLTPLTATATIATPINMTTDAGVSGYNVTLLDAPASGSTLTLSGPLSANGLGTAQVYNTGAGTMAINGNMSGSEAFSQVGGILTLGGTNTGFSGTFAVTSSGATGATLKVTNSTALEFGNATSITITNTAPLSTATTTQGTTLDLSSLLTNTTISPAINMVTDASNANLHDSIVVFPSAGNTLTVAGPLTLSGVGVSQFYNSGAGTLAVNGTVTGSIGTTSSAARGTTIINGVVSNGSGPLTVTDNATLFLNNPGPWGNTTIAYGTIKLMGANVLPYDTTVSMGQASDTNADMFDLVALQPVDCRAGVFPAERWCRAAPKRLPPRPARRS